MIKKFSLPDYYGHGQQILLLLQYQQTHKKYFYEDRVIDSVYGAHPQLLWTGGRNTILMNTPEIPMKNILEGFNQYPNISLRHVCTNQLITPELTLDYKSNYFMQRYMRKNDAVIIANNLLIDYMQKKYPNIPLIYSTTMNITDIDKVNEITENHLYVMNYNYNNNNEYIKELKHLNNIEILCAEPCQYNCPNRAKHYKAVSETVLGINKYPFICTSSSEHKIFDEIIKLPHAITNERIEELSHIGVQNYKISGRATQVPNWLYCILYYLVKPEYLLHVYIELLNSWW